MSGGPNDFSIGSIKKPDRETKQRNIALPRFYIAIFIYCAYKNIIGEKAIFKESGGGDIDLVRGADSPLPHYPVDFTRLDNLEIGFL
jgi:hypothetical protein